MSQFHVMAGGQEDISDVRVRRIGMTDITAALRSGFDDFWSKPSHYVFLCLIYPVAGIVLAYWTSGANALPLLFPLMSGFALIGPVAALGLYEISRRREQGLDTSWQHAFEVRHSPAIPAILAVGVMLMAIFILWLVTAQALYVSMYGPNHPLSLATFVSDVFTTAKGWKLILYGNAIGFLFSLAVLSTTVVAFPLLLERDVGAAAAVMASIRAFVTNPLELLVWGLIVAALLFAGFALLFAGLAIVIPVLGHATWHLYRRLIVPTGGATGVVNS
jgi:uncharacterized membrane protein